MKNRTSWVAGAVATAIASRAFAQVPQPPWLEGPNPDYVSPQTDQLWTFDNAAHPAEPDVVSNANGAPQLVANAMYESGIPQFGSGYVLSFGDLLFTIPNFGDPHRTEVWLTIDFSIIQNSGTPVVALLQGVDGSQGTLEQTSAITSVRPPFIFRISYLYSMPTCSTFNLDVQVPIASGIAVFIDQVNITTRCISCPCNWIHDVNIDSRDFFAFLTDFFNGDAEVDGIPGTTSGDFFAFLQCFFGGCS